MIRIHSRRKKIVMTEYEFNIIKLLLYALDIDIEDDNSLRFRFKVLKSNNKRLKFCDTYDEMLKHGKELTLFRPLKYDKHANLIIDMFEELEIIPTDSLVIKEILTDKGYKKYSGYFMNGTHKVEKSEVAKASNIPILKISCVAKLLFDEEDYSEFLNNLKSYLHTK